MFPFPNDALPSPDLDFSTPALRKAGLTALDPARASRIRSAILLRLTLRCMLCLAADLETLGASLKLVAAQGAASARLSRIVLH
jgi:hypothetical protein